MILLERERRLLFQETVNALLWIGAVFRTVHVLHQHGSSSTGRPVRTPELRVQTLEGPIKDKTAKPTGCQTKTQRNINY